MRVHYLSITMVLVFLMIPVFGQPSENKVKFAFDRDFPPFTFFDQGRAMGFAVDVIKEALKDEDIDLEMVPESWEKAQKDLAEGKVHITAGMARTAEREKKYLFADQPLCPFRLMAFVNKGSNIESLDQLKGKSIATQKGSWYKTALEEAGFMNIVLLDSEPEALKALASGKVSASAGAELTAFYYMKELGIRDIMALDPPLRKRDLYIAVAKDREDVLDSINRGVQRIKSNGVFDSIYAKWFQKR